MKMTIGIALAAVLAAGPALAQDEYQLGAGNTAPAAETAPETPVTPAPDYDANGIYQVFRTTDNQLDCAQLISEMNTLNATIKGQAEQQARAQNGNKAGRRIGGAALGGALGGFARGQIVRNVPGLGYAGAVAAASATDAASRAVGNAVANGGDNGRRPCGGLQRIPAPQPRLPAVRRQGLLGACLSQERRAPPSAGPFAFHFGDSALSYFSAPARASAMADATELSALSPKLARALRAAQSPGGRP